MPGTLYRLYGAADELLYVGASMNGAARLSQHASDKEWWPEVTHATFEHFEKREEAFAAECDLLDSEQGGKHNVARGRGPVSEEVLAERRAKREQREREWREREEATYRPRDARCGNCGLSFHTIPKGTLISDAACDRCGCKTIQLEAA